MARQPTLILIFAGTLCLSGCSRPDRTPAELPSQPLARPTHAATVERLQDEHLPALTSVELWQVKYGAGLKLTTDHYEIFTTVLEPLMLRMLPGFIESAYRGYNEQLPQPIETANKFRVYLFADRQQWEDFTYGFAGEQAALFCKIKTGAYYLNGSCVVYDIGPKRTLSAIGHEGWHQFNSRHFKYRLPSWLDEGVAMLFESSAYENGLFRFNPAGNLQRLSALKDTLNKSKQIPLRELVATSPGEVLATDQAQTVLAFYSQSYALVRFLREADYNRRLDSFQRLLWDGLAGAWPLDPSAGTTAEDRNLPRTVLWNRQVGPQLFESYVGSNLAGLEGEYLAFCNRIVRGVPAQPPDDPPVADN